MPLSASNLKLLSNAATCPLAAPHKHQRLSPCHRLLCLDTRPVTHVLFRNGFPNFSVQLSPVLVKLPKQAGLPLGRPQAGPRDCRLFDPSDAGSAATCPCLSLTASNASVPVRALTPISITSQVSFLPSTLLHILRPVHNPDLPSPAAAEAGGAATCPRPGPQDRQRRRPSARPDRPGGARRAARQARNRHRS
jgi:hypothetical protein